MTEALDAMESGARPIKLNFTPGQRQQLLQLLAAGAVDRDSAKGPYALGSAGCRRMVIGKLRDFGLADSRSVRPPGGSHYTAYWLTPAGVDAARALAGASSC